MNLVRKLMSASVAAAIVAGSGTITFAKNYDDVASDHKAKTEISILSDIGVIKGTAEGEFSPNELVTREQMASLLFRLMLGRDDAGRVNTTDFTDLYEPYYNGAISWANAAGYIIGTSDSTFEPKGGITKQDAMTMLVRALGQDSEKMKENYPWSYINAAVKLGLDRDLEDIGYTDTLTRAETAVILYNALTAEYLIGKTTGSGNVYYESTSIIEEVFGYSMTDAILVSTNDYSIDGGTTVKNDYVTLRGNDEDDGTFYMTVPFEQMEQNDTENDLLGHAYRIIYSTENGRHSILSAVPMTETEEFENVKLDENKNIVQIGDTKYTLVDKYSDELSTNNNELVLYAYDEDGELEVIEDIDELSELLGFYRITLMRDNGEEIARRGVIRVFEMDTLEIDRDGKINLAEKENLNIVNEADADEGDIVLYYYNEKTSELHIAKKLDLVGGIVKRLTAATVRIGDTSYDLGNKTAGITSDSIREKLELGSNVTVAIHNGAAVAVVEGITLSASGEYLVALDDAQRIYEDGSFRYVLTAFVDGKEQNIYVKNGEAKAGMVYRYTRSGNEYKLISPEEEDGVLLSGKNEFVQSGNDLDEIAYIIKSANNTSVELGGKNYYTVNRGDAESIASVAGLTGVRFVTDKNTVILVNDNGTILSRTGEYESTIKINDGAYVAAIFNNEVGSVETLRFLYISDGELGNYDLNAEFVRVLAENGLVYENGRAYVEYIVYNFETGEIETRLSKSDDLTVGEDYRCGSDDTITSVKSDHVMTGFVTGYTSGTVSIDGSAYTHASGMKIIRIVNDKGTFKIENVKLAELYMKNVEFIADKGAIKFILEGDSPKFTATASDKTITITPDFDLSDFADLKLSVTALSDADKNPVKTDGATIAIGENNTIVITLADTLEAGDYTLTFKLGSTSHKTEFTCVTVEAPEEPEEPETPEDPEQPETPENPDIPENPDNGEDGNP